LGYRDAYGPFEPLYCFGHGLSYTEFQYTNLRVSTEAIPIEGAAEIWFDLENIGDLAGDEVVQIYFQDVQASVTRPIQQLVGFKRVTLEAREKVTIKFTLPVSLLCFSNQVLRQIVEPGTIKVMVGSSAYDIRLKGSFEITGETIEVGKDRAFASQSVVSR
jgi:beta-glucosidase